MANPNRRGQAGNPVSTGMQGDTYTPFSNTHFVLPYGLHLRQKVGMVNITNVVDAGATVVYTANNDYSAGNIVSIYGVDPVAYNLQRATILSATSDTFTITSTATGTYVSGGIAQKTGDITVTIPTGITFVYAIAVGGGGGGGWFQGGGGGGGGVAWGWTIPTPYCTIGVGGLRGVSATTAPGNGGVTRYGNIIAGNGGAGGYNAVSGAGAPLIGGGGGGGSNTTNSTTGATNYWGIPGGSVLGINGTQGAGGGGGRFGSLGGIGGDGISGGGGSTNGGRGGKGLIGGGGGRGDSAGTIAGGNGGNGINILTRETTTGGTGAPAQSGGAAAGGGGGIASNGSNGVGGTGGNGGLGGGGGGCGNTEGGSGGAGILYLFY